SAPMPAPVHHRIVAASENAVRSATNTLFRVAAQKICHLYGSLGSKKIPAPSNAPRRAPITNTFMTRIRYNETQDQRFAANCLLTTSACLPRLIAAESPIRITVTIALGI